MYFMISAGNFMLFYLGLETASIPMATLVAFDKYKHKSAEAGAKYPERRLCIGVCRCTACRCFTVRPERSISPTSRCSTAAHCRSWR
ncbi:MAG: proton-conducting transporter membrane subunit [Alistipes indistinctus]